MNDEDRSISATMQARNAALLKENPQWIDELILHIYNRLPPEFQQAISGSLVDVIDSERGLMLVLKLLEHSQLFTPPLVDVFGVLCDTIVAITGITQIGFHHSGNYWAAYRVYDVWMLMSEAEFESVFSEDSSC
jgi:hypothetical protein